VAGITQLSEIQRMSEEQLEELVGGDMYLEKLKTELKHLKVADDMVQSVIE